MRESENQSRRSNVTQGAAAALALLLPFILGGCESASRGEYAGFRQNTVGGPTAPTGIDDIPPQDPPPDDPPPDDDPDDGDDPIPDPPGTADVGDGAKTGGGNSHSCVLKESGSVYCTGDNTYKQLGSDGDSTEKATEVDGLSDAEDLSVGGDHTCALKGGKVYCWGRNDKGQLGDGADSFADSATPVEVQYQATGSTKAALTGITRISAGLKHTCAVKSTGAAYCWGDNGRGQLGVKSTSASLSTANRLKLSGGTEISQVVEITAGGSHTCLVQNYGGGNRRVYCAGDNTWGQLALSAQVVSQNFISRVGTIGDTWDAMTLAAGDDHTCAILHLNNTTADKIQCWGRNDSFQIDDSSGDAVTAPVDVLIYDSSGSGVVPEEVAGGALHTCALSEGDVYCWGKNNYGQSGQEVTYSSVRYGISSPSGDGLLGHQITLLSYEQADTTVETPTLVASVDGAISIGLGSNHSCATLSGGDAVCWGSNGAGQLGHWGAGDWTHEAVSLQQQTD